MSDSTLSLRVFVSSPGDVAEERDTARRVIEGMPQHPALQGRVQFETIDWHSSGVPMSATMSPQEAVNRGIYAPAECDVVVFILWSRMGTPLPDDYRRPDGQRYMSGTEWEYDNAYTASPQPKLLVYRKTIQPTIDISDPDPEERVQQYQKVKQFFRRFRSGDGTLVGGYETFDTPADFESKLRDALVAISRTQIAEVEAVRRAPSKVVPGRGRRDGRGVFISYSHADEYWLERLKIHLRPLERDAEMEYWDDTKLRPGALWREEIQTALARARVAVLLVSADFLASDFIAYDELPPLLAAASTEGLVILPVVVSACRFTRTPTLSRFQSVNNPEQPLNSFSRAEAEAMLVKVTDSVDEAMGRE